MTHTVWLLPDFIGHAWCFSDLTRAAGARWRARSFQYHDFWPYNDVPALAAAIVASCQDDWPDWVLGYSFGGLVAYETVCLLSARAPAAPPRLLLIDAHPPHAESGPRVTSLRALAAYPDYQALLAKIDALCALGEVNPACIEGNLRCFAGYAPHKMAAHAVEVVSGGQDARRAGHWTDLLPRAACLRVDAAHDAMLSDAAAIMAILSVFTEGNADENY